jgi:hypothetical protein
VIRELHRVLQLNSEMAAPPAFRAGFDERTSRPSDKENTDEDGYAIIQ